MMTITRISLVAVAMGSASTLASAAIVVPEDPGIYAPCEGARAHVVWIGSDAGYTGELSFLDTSSPTAGVDTLFNNHAATPGDRIDLPGTFAQGERLDFRYEVISGGLDVFSTDDVNDWAQFSVDASDPGRVRVGIEDIRLPRGDNDHNDAVFEVVFECGNTVPAPGSLALLGAGGLMIGRRRRGK